MAQQFILLTIPIKRNTNNITMTQEDGSKISYNKGANGIWTVQNISEDPFDCLDDLFEERETLLILPLGDHIIISSKDTDTDFNIDRLS